MFLRKETKYFEYFRYPCRVWGLLPVVGCFLLTAGCGSHNWTAYATGGYSPEAKRLILERKGLDDTDGYRDTPLLWAARYGHADIVQFMIGEKVDINEANQSTGETALILAVKGNHSEVVQLLIQHGADLTIQDNTSYSPLDWASQQGNSKILELVMSHPSNDVVSPEDGNPVVAAVYSGELDIIQSLLNEGYSINQSDEYGDTPYIAAVKTGKMQIVSFLQEKGADIHAIDGFGRSTLMIAAQTGHVDIASHLIREGADIHGISKDGYTLLMFASANGHLEMVDYLLKKGADLNRLDRDYRSALFLAAVRGQWHITKKLLRHGGYMSLDDIRTEDKRPYVMAPLYAITGQFFLEKNDKDMAVEYLNLGQKTFTKLATQYSEAASDSARQKAIKEGFIVLGKTLVVVAMAAAPILERKSAEQQAEQDSEMAALKHGETYDQYHQTYSAALSQFQQDYDNQAKLRSQKFNQWSINQWSTFIFSNQGSQAQS